LTYSVFNSENKQDHTKVRAFLDNPPTIARYDRQKYSWLKKLTEKQHSFFWRPTEIDLYRDAKDFKLLTDHEKHIFTSNLKRQILLDSVQGRAPVAAFGPITSLPELETWLQTWTFSETIHSLSYTHIIENIYPDASPVFDEMLDIQEIVDCAKDVSVLYDKQVNLAMTYCLRKAGVSPHTQSDFETKLKESIYLSLMAVNILEGVRFYVSFACSWAFAELKKMEGNAKIIKLIARDENLHLAGTQHLLKILPSDDLEFFDISEKLRPKCIDLFTKAVDQEKTWAKYLFKDGSMIGLSEQLLCDYIEWIANKRMTAVGLPTQYKNISNPLPWTAKWIAGSEVQVAPQEVEVSSYTIGAVKQDVTENTFKGMSL
jgi:ribonucleoside-diphosphate reductase beta chain